MDNLRHQVSARRVPARPEEVRRGRTAAAGGLRGAEPARVQDPGDEQGPCDRIHGSFGAALQSVGEAGQDGGMAEVTRATKKPAQAVTAAGVDVGSTVNRFPKPNEQLAKKP